MMMLNEMELRERVQRHCGQRLAKNEPVCESCQKKLSIAKNIDRQRDVAWRQHDEWIRQQRDRSKRETERHV
jgi:predicted amidophosphoribosyltransferase